MAASNQSTAGDGGGELDAAAHDALRHRHYQVVHFITRGGMSEVYKVAHGLQYYAAKVMAHRRLHPVVRQVYLPNEVKVARRVHHPYVVATREVIELEQHTILVLELAAGDLMSLLLTLTSPDVERSRRWLAQMAAGLAYLHRMGIAHQDIKPDNVMLFRDGTVAKLGDFGYACECLDPDTGQVLLLSIPQGTLEYRAPEKIPVLEERCDVAPFDPFVADVFSMGIMLFTLVTMDFPFRCGPQLRSAAGRQQLRRDICAKNWKPTERIARDRNLYALLCQMLNPSVSERITADQILAHPWLREQVSQLAQ